MDFSYEEQVRKLSPAQARLEASRCLVCEDAPCTKACPAGVDAMRFIRAIRFRNERRALDLIRQSNILAGTCGTICPHENLCEGACSAHALHGAPVAIGALQRYASDAEEWAPGPPSPEADWSKHQVAVVGSGPAGLGAAAELARGGVRPVVFDPRDRAGGMVNYGVPRFRCADAVVNRDVAFVESLGVEFRLGEAAKDLDALLEEFDAVILAGGLGKGKSANLPGEDLDGVHRGLDFIDAVNSDLDSAATRLPLGERVVILGAGQVGMDLAEHALRIGATAIEVTSRRGTDSIRHAAPGEFDTALTHGVSFLTCAVPDEIQGKDGRAVAVRGHRVRWTADGVMEDLEGSEFRLPADSVLVAAGQKAEAATMPLLDGLETKWGRLVTDESGKTSRDCVWAAGDLRYRGGGTVVGSVAEGRDAAKAILAWLDIAPMEVSS